MTDEWDWRVLTSLLNEFYKEMVINHSFEPLGLPAYSFSDEDMTHSETLAFIKNLPMNDPPQIFGFHENANIIKELNETTTLCSCLLDLGEIEGSKKLE